MLIAAIVVSALLGVFLGCKLTSWSITWMITKGVIDLYYHGQRSDEFRWW